MISTTPPTGKAQPKKLKLAPGNLKRDINLLPANENSEKMARRGTIIVGVAVGLVIFYFVAIFWPSAILHSIQDMANNAQNQIITMSGADKEFNDLSLQQKELSGMVSSLSQSAKDNLQPADLIKQLSSACPSSISLTTYSQSEEGLTLDGVAHKDSDIAQFIVNLKTITIFDRVVLVSVQDKTDKSMSSTVRQFEIKCLLPAASPSQSPAQPQPAPSTAVQGGTGK